MQQKLFNNIPLENNTSGNSINARRSRSFPLFGGQSKYRFVSNYVQFSEELTNRYLEIINSTKNSDNSIYFGEVNMQFQGIRDSSQTPPDYNSDNYELQEDFKKTASSVWVPNTTSPDPSGQREDAQQEDRYVNNNKSSLIYGSGLGSSLSPKKSSEIISNLTFDNLQKGSSEPSNNQPSANVPQQNFNRG